MEPPKIDLNHPDQVIKELFEDDRWVKDEFAKHLAADLTELSERLAACFKALPQLNSEAEKVGTQQTALVAGFAFGVVDDLLISTKLLISGKLMAAGNLMRQAVEGIAVAVLCSSKDLLIIEQKKNTPTTACYWEKLVAGDPRAHGHRANALLAINQTRLGISADAVTRLKQARSHYNLFSHPGTFGLASRVALGKEGQVYAGGHFDIEKVGGYRIEVGERIGLCGVLPNLIDNLVKRMGA